MKKTMWTVQILLALAFAAAGAMKLVTPRSQLVANGMGWAESFSDSQVRLIGAAEALGAIGLVVPAATGLLPALTPVAAGCLAFLMGGAVMTHVRRGEPPFAPLILGLLAVFVVWMRLQRPTPSRHRGTPA